MNIQNVERIGLLRRLIKTESDDKMKEKMIEEYEKLIETESESD